MEPHKLLPARTPQGVQVEDLIKEMYEAKRQGKTRDVIYCWLKIAQIADEQGLAYIHSWIKEA